MDVLSEIRRYMRDDLRISNADEIDEDKPLVQDAVLDSIEMMQLVVFLESRFGIEVDDVEVVPANFRTLSRIGDYVRRKLEDG